MSGESVIKCSYCGNKNIDVIHPSEEELKVNPYLKGCITVKCNSRMCGVDYMILADGTVIKIE